MALKVLGNLFQSENLIEWISGWWSPIVALFYDFSLLFIPHKANLCLIPIKATVWLIIQDSFEEPSYSSERDTRVPGSPGFEGPPHYHPRLLIGVLTPVP